MVELDGKLAANKTAIIDLLNRVKRDGIDKLIKWLEESDYFYAPASRQYHGAYPGGLAEHSLNVFRELKRLSKAYPEIECTEENIIISALLHDICKVNFYASEKRNRKNDEGKWEQYDSYSIKEKFHYGGHGQKSVFLAQKFVNLTIEEAVAINNHMSAFQGNANDVGAAFDQFPFAWLLSVADQAATYVIESGNV